MTVLQWAPKIRIFALLSLICFGPMAFAELNRQPAWEVKFETMTADREDRLVALMQESVELTENTEFIYATLESLKKDQPIKNYEAEQINSIILQYVSIRDRVGEVLEPWSFLTEQMVSINLSHKRSSRIDEQEDRNENASPGQENKKSYNIRVNPRDMLGKEIIHVVEVSLAGSLPIFQGYISMIDPVMGIKNLRRLLKDDYKDTMYQFSRSKNGFVDHLNRDRVLRLVDFYLEYLNWQREQGGQLTAPSNNFFANYLVSSSLFKDLSENGYHSFKTSFAYFKRSIGDGLGSLLSSLGYAGSAVVGNLAGLVQFRSGRLKRMSDEERVRILRKLRPLDILIEKTPFRLTDSFIPGYYGHVAMYLGTEAQLKAAGLWDHPLVMKYQDKIKEGKTIIESVRIPGVRLTSFGKFIDIDDLLILRRKNMDPEKVADYLITAFEQLGKNYDFNFDVETQREIVCSELVYMVFPDMEWPTTKTLGRFTISPDNVAIKATGNDRAFDIIELYKGGRLILWDERQAAVTNLLAYGELEPPDVEQIESLTEERLNRRQQMQDMMKDSRH